ncbi:MAG: hypothetical protein ACK56I_25215, partial [bacterium]
RARAAIGGRGVGVEARRSVRAVLAGAGRGRRAGRGAPYERERHGAEQSKGLRVRSRLHTTECTRRSTRRTSSRREPESHRAQVVVRVERRVRLKQRDEPLDERHDRRNARPRR